MMKKAPLATTMAVFAMTATAWSQNVLVEAESFENHGGWKLDTQFIHIMGSPYMMAHGLGEPVEDAETTVTFPETGTWHVWVRTKDWVETWEAPGDPGRFQLVINGTALEQEFGTEGAKWHWQKGGTVEITSEDAMLALRDLTGFNGRCDAIMFTQDEGFTPDNTNEVLPKWRREAMGLPGEPEDMGEYDIVFVGGGYAGTCGAISAARMGLKVALIQNRDVLGGNGSSEVRVWAKGNTPPGLYPVGDIVQEITDTAKASPGTYEEFGDEKKLGIVGAEEKIDLYLGHHAFDVEMEEGGLRIKSVTALETRTNRVRVFRAKFFCDSTGHGTIGAMAGADRTMAPGGRMGMSNMWRWQHAEGPREFPETPWALNLDETGFPYPRKFHAEWFWESGYDKHPLVDKERIRDWNLRANFGAWNAIKNKGAYSRQDETGNGHQNSELTWMAYVGGTRETQQLLGDVILTEEDVINGREFEDGAVLTTWSIDLHYPKEQYLGDYADNPFIAVAVHGKGVDRRRGYAVPYRCFYSRNIENLFMAGRNVSVTREGLGTVRVMKTGGMMGVVVGKAAAIAVDKDCTPRHVYSSYLPQLKELMNLRGYMRRTHLNEPFFKDPALPEIAEQSFAQMAGGIDVKDVEGLVVDNMQATLAGNWSHGGGLKGFIGEDYSYTGAGAPATATWIQEIPEAGTWDIRLSWQPHENRSSKTPVQVLIDGEVHVSTTVNQQEKPLLKQGFDSLGRVELEEGQIVTVIISNEGVDGNIHADAMQLLKRD